MPLSEYSSAAVRTAAFLPQTSRGLWLLVILTGALLTQTAWAQQAYSPLLDSGGSEPPVALIESPAQAVVISPGDSVEFSGSGSDSDGTVTSYLWNFDSVRSDSTLQNPGSVVFTAPGAYQIYLTVTDDSGVMDFAKVWVYVSTAGTTPQPTNIEAFFRSGQTFITWGENTQISGERYRIYRHSEPIDQLNLDQAVPVAEVDDLSSFHSHENPNGGGSPIGQTNFIIEDKVDPNEEGINAELSDDTGLFVFTNREPQAVDRYYAVTTIDASGSENRSDFSQANATTNPVSEQQQTPRPVHVATQNDGTSRIGYAYTLFMDYSEWNPSYKGYAYNYTVNLPVNYDFTGSRTYPTIVHIEGWGSRYRYDDFNNDSFLLRADDATQVWYYGFGANHDGSQFNSSLVVNYHEKYLVEATLATLADTELRTDPDRVFAYGHSMGGSGTLALGMRYPSLFAAIYASQPLTDYSSSSFWLSDVEAKWGSSLSGGLPALSLPLSDNALNSIRRYNGVPVFEWQNAGLNLATRSRDPMAYLQTGHATADTTVDWFTQGEPWYAVLEGSGHTAQWSGHIDDGGCHCWMGFRGMNIDMMTGGGFGEWEEWEFVSPEARPALANAPWEEVGDLTWSASFYPEVAPPTLDSADRFEITLQAGGQSFRADVTPRFLQSFLVQSGSSYEWSNQQEGQVIASGTVTANDHGLVTIEDFEITTSGNRLILTGSDPRPPALPEITIALDRNVYSQETDSAEVSLEILPGDEITIVDITITIEFAGNPEPLPIGFRDDYSLDFDFIRSFPGLNVAGLPLGDHTLTAELTDPISGELIGERSEFSFTVEP